ncbi:hypothetical protein FCIRC_11914 [Fusarium circinatum]|uniref:Uncharacterized protein n=1 Tax=Fusarium circinatum TaxID=48490 RepID=A0A8H5SWE7_FUSCI|nr:hypothetical protein FCIRC_11914 [Fusarium circinatum]
MTLLSNQFRQGQEEVETKLREKSKVVLEDLMGKMESLSKRQDYPKKDTLGYRKTSNIELRDRRVQDHVANFHSSLNTITENHKNPESKVNRALDDISNAKSQVSDAKESVDAQSTRLSVVEGTQAEVMKALGKISGALDIIAGQI